VTDLAMQYAELQRTVGDVHTARGDLAHGKQRLHDSFGDYLGTGWTGAAADSFRTGWTTWSEGVDEVLDALGSMAALLTENAREFQTHDSMSGLTMDLLQGRLGGTD
jgi:WXG100 family type VII secretion target